MSELHFYADVESIDALAAGTSKALLVGGDFGYGNFGDVLQHSGSVARFHRCSELAVVSVLSLDAISRHVSIAALRGSYGSAALIFVSAAPINVELQRQLGLKKVESIRNVACIQLYGGGFLNDSWGGFILEVTEFLLRRVPTAGYFISGQQVSRSYAGRVAQHVREFKPLLIGVRDHDSLSYLREQGIDAKFSFDDAVEPLLALSRKVGIRKGSGLFIHLNSSGYTGNDAALSEVLAHMRILAKRKGADRAVLLQAFQDAREEVVDSLETVKRLEGAFPFAGLDAVMLVSIITGAAVAEVPSDGLMGDFGYACSYHVTLWLQLNGIPCWLRGGNSYYDQKRRSLGMDRGFEQFLADMPLVDHGENLAARSSWTERLETMISEVTTAPNSMTLPADSVGAQFRSLNYKGEPRLSVRLDQSWAAVRGLQQEKAELAQALENAQAEAAAEAVRHGEDISELRRMSVEEVEDLRRVVAELKSAVRSGEVEAARHHQSMMDALAVATQNERLLEAARKNERQLSGRVEALGEQVTYLGAECRLLEQKLREAERGWYEACRGNEQLVAVVSALEAEKRDLQDCIERFNGEVSGNAQRLLAFTEQLTLVGSEAREQRQQAESNWRLLQEVSERERSSADKLQQIYSSRSWRFTRPIRVLNRFLQTGRFDPAGQVGMFEAARIIGGRLPLPRSWISSVGKFLRRLRRT